MPFWLWRQMLWNLRSPHRCAVSADLKGRLLLAITDAAPDSGADLLLKVLDDYQPHDDDSLVLELFSRLHSPRIRDTSRDRFTPRDQEPPGSNLLERFRHLGGC